MGFLKWDNPLSIHIFGIITSSSVKNIISPRALMMPVFLAIAGPPLYLSLINRILWSVNFCTFLIVSSVEASSQIISSKLLYVCWSNEFIHASMVLLRLNVGTITLIRGNSLFSSISFLRYLLVCIIQFLINFICHLYNP